MDKTLWYKEAISSIGFSFLISSTVLWSPGCFKQHKYRLAGGSRPPRKKEVSLSHLQRRDRNMGSGGEVFAPLSQLEEQIWGIGVEVKSPHSKGVA